MANDQNQTAGGRNFPDWTSIRASVGTLVTMIVAILTFDACGVGAWAPWVLPIPTWWLFSILAR